MLKMVKAHCQEMCRQTLVPMRSIEQYFSCLDWFDLLGCFMFDLHGKISMDISKTTKKMRWHELLWEGVDRLGEA